MESLQSFGALQSNSYLSSLFSLSILPVITQISHPFHYISYHNLSPNLKSESGDDLLNRGMVGHFCLDVQHI